MKFRAVALLALTAALTACGGGGGGGGGGGAQADPAGCRTAMREQLQDAIDAGATATPGTPPSQCDGIDAGTIRKYAGELMADQIGKALTSALPEATGTTGVTAACRAWIKKELRETGGGINATEGYGVCGNLSEEEMSRAIAEAAVTAP